MNVELIHFPAWKWTQLFLHFPILDLRPDHPQDYRPKRHGFMIPLGYSEIIDDIDVDIQRFCEDGERRQLSWSFLKERFLDSGEWSRRAEGSVDFRVRFEVLDLTDCLTASKFFHIHLCRRIPDPSKIYTDQLLCCFESSMKAVLKQAVLRPELC